MGLLNKKLAAAIESLAYIAVNSTERPVSSKEICEELGLKLRYTEQIMQKLVRARILKSVRGAGGGYLIAKDRRKISLAEIYDIVKQLGTAKDLKDSNPEYRKLANEISEKIDAETNRILGNITLEDIYNSAKTIKPVAKPLPKGTKGDFVI